MTLGYKIAYQVESENIIIDEVLHDIDQAIDLEDIPTNKSKYLHFKSFVLNQLKKYEDALETIETAIELDPDDLHIHWMKYNILIGL